MKKLLLILIIVFAGINCQAQKPIYQQRIIYRPDAIQCVIDQMFDQVYARIDSLEKRLSWHEKMHKEDSLKPKINTYTRSIPTSYSILPYTVKTDTISWFDLYDCIEPPKDKIIRIWKNGKSSTWVHGVDSITFK